MYSAISPAWTTPWKTLQAAWRPVSYTHLDVYKRQVQEPPQKEEAPDPYPVLAAQVLRLIGESDGSRMDYGEDDAQAAVSYTHRAQEEVQCLEEQRQNAIAPEAPPYSPWGNVQECETLCLSLIHI